MEFGFSPEVEEFRQHLRGFARDRLAPYYRASDRKGQFEPGIQAAVASLGLLGLRIPEQYGGQEADYVTSGMVCEELARGDFNVGWMVVTSLLLSDIIVASGTPDQCAAWLPSIASGEHIPAIGLTEPEAGTDAASLRLRAVVDGDGWRLDGEKTSISFGMTAEKMLVFARTSADGPKGITAFYVDMNSDGIERSPFEDVGARAIGRASIHFDGVRVPSSRILGVVGEGFTQVMRGFDYSRALIALLCIGTALESLDEAITYAGERKTFGRPIATNQGVSFPIVEYETYLRSARLLAYEALSMKDRGLAHTLEAALVKWWVPRMAGDAVHQALLTFGQLGYSDEFPFGQRMRDILGMEIGDGTDQVAKIVASRQLFGRHAAR